MTKAQSIEKTTRKQKTKPEKTDTACGEMKTPNLLGISGIKATRLQQSHQPMCANYDPLITPKRFSIHFNVDASDLPLDLKFSLWPGYFGPFLRKHEFADVGDDAVPFRELSVGSFGLIPHWSKDNLIARKTYNARSETVHEKPSYRDAWKAARHCIIPAEAIYEPDWRSGKAVPTRISRADGKPMGIAGIWGTWRSPAGEVVHSFTMLTINADNHSVMRQFHKPDDEKRMVVILNDQDYDAWLQAPANESRHFLQQYPAEELLSVSKVSGSLF